MQPEQQKKRNYLVEVWFPIEKDEEGYPESKDWEQLLARSTDTVDQFEIESVPFYLKNVSRGDIVKAKVVDAADGQIFEFDGVLEHRGHNTYRLLIRKKREDDPDSRSENSRAEVWLLKNSTETFSQLMSHQP